MLKLKEDLTLIVNDEIHNVKSYQKRSKLWFDLEDVCEALSIEDDEKILDILFANWWVGKLYKEDTHYTDSTLPPDVILIPEEGLYAAICHKGIPKNYDHVDWIIPTKMDLTAENNLMINNQQGVKITERPRIYRP
jgi:prophage antirepressor-like protein